ncbi:phage tail spike protein [Cytobacillus sp. FJAT-53684]|uniref:Phage tail spike protein n=1 Tax=Cytobacillus mangrovibacter TaxID=3299024 RepID=A0ABW6K1E0_9BACI
MRKLLNRSTPIWIYNIDEELKLILDPKGDLPHFDSWYTEQLNGAITLEFSVPANDPRVTAIENDGRAVIRDQDGNLIEFIIRQPEDTNDINGPIKRVFAEGGDYELIDEWMTGYKADNVTLKTALEAVLSKTRISVGIVHDFGTQSVDLAPMSVKAATVELINLFGGERRYRVDTSVNQIVNRYIDVLSRRGENTGKRFEHGKDIQSVRRTIDSTGIKTALYGYGAGGINDGPRVTFASVEWSVANGDPIDKPIGQTWIGDPDALQQWGYDRGTRHRFGEYSGQEEDPAELLLSTWNHLQTLNDAVRTYDFKVALLEKVAGYKHEAVRLGDTVILIDREIQPKVEVSANIIEYRQNLNDDQLDEVTVGNFRNSFDSAVRIRNTEKVIERKQGNWDNKETPEGAHAKAIAEAEKAIEEAQRRIDAAKLEIQQAVNEIEQTKLDLENAQALIDDTLANPQNYNGEFAGDLIADSLIVRGPIISQDATITGRIAAANATFVNATIETGNIINANIQNATITGTLAGVGGTFTGDLVGARITSTSVIDVATDIRVGNNIYLGGESHIPEKMIRFKSGATITSPAVSSGIEISAEYFYANGYKVLTEADPITARFG